MALRTDVGPVSGSERTFAGAFKLNVDRPPSLTKPVHGAEIAQAPPGDDLEGKTATGLGPGLGGGVARTAVRSAA